MQQVRESTWKPRPLPFVEISWPTVEMPEKPEPEPAAGTNADNEQSAESLPQDLSVYCGFCGGRVLIDDVFCAHCGAKQPVYRQKAPASELAWTPRLTVVGFDQAATFELKKTTTSIGRTDAISNIFPDIDLSKYDPDTKISRRHARIFVASNIFFIEDLGSVNGIVLNSSTRLLPRQPHPLLHGDQIHIGETTLWFLYKKGETSDETR